MNLKHSLCLFGCLAAWLSSLPAQGQSFTFGNFQVVSSNRVGRTEFEYVLRITVSNRVASAQGLSAQVFSTSSNTVVVQGNVTFGDVAFGAGVASSTTFTIRQNRLVPFDPSVLQWFASAQSMPLAVAIDSPISGLLTNGTNLIVRGSVGPAVQAVLVGRTNAVLTGTNFTAIVSLEEGANTISALATNSYGGAGLANVTVTRDTTPPLVNIEAPVNGTVLSSRQVTVTGLINDAVPGTVNPEQATVLVNGLPAMVLNRTYAIPDVLLTPGKNLINVLARDRAGNENQRTVEVTFLDLASQKRLVPLAGDAQTGVIGTTLPVPLIVELVDANGIVQTNQPIAFTVTRNDGTLFAAPDSGRTLSLRTDDKGQAAVFFQLGTRTGVGNNQVAVTTPGVPGEVFFCANAIGAPPHKITPLFPETQVGETGKPLAQPWTAYVTDAGGNPVAGAPLTFMVFQGEGGSLEGAMTVTKNTDNDGRASVVHTLGTQEGINNNVVFALIAGVTNASATFTASARAPQRVEETRVTGLVLDNANRPMSNILCIILGTTRAAITDMQGQFVISNAPVGSLRLLVDARERGYPGEWHTLEFNIVALPGRENSVDRPIYMLPLDTDSATMAGGAQDVTLHLKGVPGSSLTILAHSLRDASGKPITNQVMWTQVNAERIPMTPPLGSQPLFTSTVQPAGLRFDPPARMCIPNTGAPAGQVVELFGFDHDIGSFVSVGTATVSSDGSQICSDPGFGVTKSGWHPFVPPPPPCTPVCSGPPTPKGCVIRYDTIPPAGKCDCPTYKPVMGEITGVSVTAENSITECMEGREVTFTATATANFTPGPDAPIQFTFHFQRANGSMWTATEWSFGLQVDHDAVADQVLDGDIDHKFTTPIFVDAAACGSTKTSSTIMIDVYELWIEYFRRDMAHPWKVVVGEPIEYSAIASMDCTMFVWDMQDGVPDKWNPTGGNMKQGSGLTIPYSDLPGKNGDYFGEAYGTVDVMCEDGEGNEHHFYSTTMSGQKVKVFFDPQLNEDGGAPSQSKPPAWFLFWQPGAVPDLVDFEYKHFNSYGESQVLEGFFWDTHVLRVGIPAGGTHYPAGLLINGVQYGGAQGIDCCAEVTDHEKWHNLLAVEINGGAADTDPATATDNFLGDSLPDSREAGLGCSTMNKDTFNLAVIKSPVYSGYGDNEFAAISHAHGKTGVINKDWSKGGKQW